MTVVTVVQARPACSIIQRAALRRFVDAGVPAGGRVLDAPCGDGHLTLSLRDAGFDARGADIDATAASILGEAFQRADLTERLPWADAFFDAIISTEGIEHLENHFAYLREIHRVLKPGGTFILTTPNTLSVRSRVRFFGSGFFNQDPRPLREARHPLHHIGLASLPELRYELHTTGFELRGVHATHTKPVAYLYALFVPWMWLYTTVAFRKERDPEQRRQNRSIKAALFSRAVLFGENLLVTARRL